MADGSHLHANQQPLEKCVCPRGARLPRRGHIFRLLSGFGAKGWLSGRLHRYI